jgi:hypothetical protein
VESPGQQLGFYMDAIFLFMAMLVCLRLQNSEVVLCLDVYMDAIFLFMTMLVLPEASEFRSCALSD